MSFRQGCKIFAGRDRGAACGGAVSGRERAEGEPDHQISRQRGVRRDARQALWSEIVDGALTKVSGSVSVAVGGGRP